MRRTTDSPIFMLFKNLHIENAVFKLQIHVKQIQIPGIKKNPEEKNHKTGQKGK